MPRPRAAPLSILPELPRTSHDGLGPKTRIFGLEFGFLPARPAVSGVLLACAAISIGTLGVSDGQIAVGAPAAAAEATDLAREWLASGAGATKVASEETAHERELREKVRTLVEQQFDGDYQAAFDHFAGADQRLSRSEVVTLLKRAGIGSMLTRGAWADGVMERFDANKDGGVTWAEFVAVCPIA